MLQLSTNCLYLQTGIMSHIPFTIKNISDTTLSYKIRSNNQQHYKVDPVFGLLESGETVNISIKNIIPAHHSFLGDQFQVQYLETSKDVDLREFWKGRKSLDFVVLNVEVIDVTDNLITELQNKIEILNVQIKQTKESYHKEQKRIPNLLQNEGISLGISMLCVILSLVIGGLFR